MAIDEPWLMTHTPSTPSSIAPPDAVGVELRRQRGQPGQQHLGGPLGLLVGGEHLEQGVHEEAQRPLERLERHVAGEAVGHDDVGGCVQEVAPLDVADEARCRRACASRAWVSLTRGVPLDFSSPIDSSATVGSSTP